MAGRGVTIDFNANVARFTSSVDKMTNDLAKFQTNADRMSKNIDRSFSMLGSGLRGVFAGLTTALSLRELGQMADSFTNMQARLKLATRDAQEFAEANVNIKRISESAKSPLEATANLYTRISQSLLDVGGTQKQIANTTQALALGLRISGATANESSSAMLQFSQAVGAGALRGEEFNAVNEAAPRVMKALADSLGVPVGKLREMAHEGQITRDVLVEGLGSQLPKLIKEAETLPNTIGTAFQDAKNELLLTIGLVDKFTGASAKAAETVGLVGKALKGWRDAIGDRGPDSAISDQLQETQKLMDSALKMRKLFDALGVKPPKGASDSYINELNEQALELKKSLEGVREEAEKVAEPTASNGMTDLLKKAEEEAKRKEALKEAEKASKALASQQKTLIEGLQKEADTLGMTASQMKVYEAGLLKISGARLDGVRANAERIENFKQEQDVLEAMRTTYADAADAYLKFIGTIAKDNKAAADKLDRLKVEIGLVGKTEAQRKRILALYDTEIKYKERLKELDGLDTGATVRKIQEEALIKAKASEEEIIRFEEQLDKQKTQAADMQKVWDNFGFNLQRNLGDQLFQVLDGNFKNIGASFASMLKRMLADALAANLTQALFGKDGGLLKAGLSIFSSLLGMGSVGGGAAGGMKVTSGGISGFAANGAYFDGNVAAFANGGIVNSPTLFKFAEGGSFRTGLMGEAGPEAIMPLKRDSKGRLGVSGGGGMSVNYAPVINVDSRADRAEVHAIVSKAVKQGNADLVDKLARQGAI